MCRGEVIEFGTNAKVSEAGSNTSAVFKVPPPDLPPTISTFPLGINVAVCWRREEVIFGSGPKVSEAGSNSSAEFQLVVPFVPPVIKKVGEALWLRQLKAHDTLIREKAALHAGQVVKSLGDGFMLAFPSPFDALSFAAAIQMATRKDGPHGASMPVRIGVHLGDTFRDADDFYGRTVVLASRLAMEARGGEVVVSDEVRQATEGSGEFTFVGTAEIELRGFSELQKIASLKWR